MFVNQCFDNICKLTETYRNSFCLNRQTNENVKKKENGILLAYL